MMNHPARAATAAVLTALLTLTVGCSHLPRPQWPWQHRPAPPPQEVHELVITTQQGTDAAFPQYWRENTLVIDMKSASTEGSIVLKPREHTVWPARIAFRVMPGQFGVLEVRAKQRVVLPIAPGGTKPVDLELPPGVYIMRSPQIDVSWAQPPAS